MHQITTSTGTASTSRVHINIYTAAAARIIINKSAVCRRQSAVIINFCFIFGILLNAICIYAMWHGGGRRAAAHGCRLRTRRKLFLHCFGIFLVLSRARVPFINLSLNRFFYFVHCERVTRCFVYVCEERTCGIVKWRPPGRVHTFLIVYRKMVYRRWGEMAPSTHL